MLQRYLSITLLSREGISVSTMSIKLVSVELTVFVSTIRFPIVQDRTRHLHDEG